MCEVVISLCILLFFLKIIFFLSTHLTPNQKVENDLDSRILVSDFEKLLFFI